MDWEKRVGKPLDKLATYLVGGFHAMPSEDATGIAGLPSRHRLYNAGGMFISFLAGAKLRDIMRGFDNTGKKITKEEVFFLLRPLHGIIKHNPHADSMYDRWMSITSKIIPAVFGAAGAILGSVYFFQSIKTEQQMNAVAAKVKGGEQANLIDLDNLGSHAQSWPLRIAAGIFATFSAASGLTLLYGFFLNNAFASAANRKMFAGAAEFFGFKGIRKVTNTSGSTQFGPGKAMENSLKEIQNIYERAARSNTPLNDEELAKQVHEIANGSLKALFPDLREEDVKKQLTTFFKEAYTKGSNTSKGAMNIVKDALFEGGVKTYTYQPPIGTTEIKTEDGRKFQGGTKFVKFLSTQLGMSKTEIESARFGNGGAVSAALKPFTAKHKLQDSWAKTVASAGLSDTQRGAV